jgi:serine phosphatase RsbU (regulator of sigma subunit)
MKLSPPAIRWRSELATAGISMFVGALISGLFGIGRGLRDYPAFLITGAIVGFSIYLCNSILGLVLEPVLARLGKRTHLVADMFVYLIGGVSGWLLGFLLAAGLFSSRLTLEKAVRGPLVVFIGITAVMSVLIGLIFRTYETLTRRLRVREWAERELDLARTLQNRLLPSGDLEGDGFSVVARNLPAHTVAGDFYDVITLDDGSLFLAVADVAGKGVGASMIMASVKSALPYVARDGVAAAAAALNVKLCGELGAREFVAMLCARYEPQSGRLELVNAGCPDAYLIRASGADAISNPGTRLPLGIRQDIAYEPTVITLAAGDRFLMITDGIPEAPANGEPLGYEALHALLETRRSLPDTSGSWMDGLLTDVRAVVDEGMEDDWTALLLQRTR